MFEEQTNNNKLTLYTDPEAYSLLIASKWNFVKWHSQHGSLRVWLWKPTMYGWHMTIMTFRNRIQEKWHDLWICFIWFLTIFLYNHVYYHYILEWVEEITCSVSTTIVKATNNCKFEILAWLELLLELV